MPVSKKPTAPVSVEQFIQSAATAATATTPKTDSVQPVQLRLPEQLLAEIDAAVAKRKPAPSRHQWILEAIYDKLSSQSNN